MKKKHGLPRREFIKQTSLLASAAAYGGFGLPGRVFGATPSITAESERPVLAQGIQIGDVRDDRAIVWSRADRPARLLVEWDVTERFRNPRARARPARARGRATSPRASI